MEELEKEKKWITVAKILVKVATYLLAVLGAGNVGAMIM